MLRKCLLYVLGALVVILWAGQPIPSQSAPGTPLMKQTCGDLWPVEQGRKWGYIDKTGRVIIPCQFDSAANFSEGLAAVHIKEKTGYIDATGKFVIPPRFLTGFPFSGGLALVVISGSGNGVTYMNQLGYVNRSGQVVIQLKEALDSRSLRISYQDGDLTCSDGMVRVWQNDKVGFMDKTGRQSVPPRYDDAGLFFEGLAAVKLGDKYGYVDRSGKMIIPLKFSHAGIFSEGLAAVKLGNKYGYVDRSGKMIIPPRFSEADPFSEGLALVALNGNKRGYIDKTGRLVITGVESAWARAFSEGLAAVRGKNGKYGFIDKTGKFVIPPQFARVGDFSEGLAAVELVDGPWPGNLAYVNQTGQMVIKSKSMVPDRPTWAEFGLHYYRFCGGVAKVSLGKEADSDAEGYINREGKIIWPRNAESLGTTTNWKSYKTVDISLRYPPDFKVESLEGQSGGGGYLDTGIVKIRFPDKAFQDENTNCREAFLVVSKSSKPERVANCTKFNDLGGPDNGIGRIKINGVDFKTRTMQEGAAGNRYESKLYRNMHKGSCYEIALVVRTVNKDAFEPPLKEFDKQKAYCILEQMRDTLAFIK
jgi:hypothetical protein